MKIKKLKQIKQEQQRRKLLGVIAQMCPNLSSQEVKRHFAKCDNAMLERIQFEVACGRDINEILDHKWG